MRRVHEFEFHHDPNRRPLNVNIGQSGLNAGFSHDGLHMPGDVLDAVVGGGGYLDSLLRFPYLNNRIKLGNH
jgi:hypothetical protein